MARRRDLGTGATITELTWQGRTVDLRVSDKGIFYALIAEDRIEAKSLDSLKDKVKRHIDALGKIEIPVTLLESHYDEEPVLHDVLLVRLRRDRPVIRDAEGDEDTISYAQTLLRRLSPEEQAALIVAWQAYKTAETAYNDLVAEADRNAGDLLKEAAEALK